MADHSKIGKRSKAKGKRYESRAAKLLTDFTGVNFRKTPGSGGWNKAGGVKVADYVFCGDIICDNKHFVFSVEAKSRKSFSFVAILKNPEIAAFTGWWKQCIEDAVSIHKLPFMMFKPDYQEDFVALTEEGESALGIPNNTPRFTLDVYDDVPTPKIFRWKTLISSVNPEFMFQRDKKWHVAARPKKSEQEASE